MNLELTNILPAIVGGVLIGLAAAWLYLSLGRVAGISGIAANALLRAREQRWAVFFVAGLGLGGWLAYAILGGSPLGNVSLEAIGWPALIIGGILVGIGTRMGSGCTSGHGVCGIARFSMRSVVATVVFLSVGIATATGLSVLG